MFLFPGIPPFKILHQNKKNIEWLTLFIVFPQSNVFLLLYKVQKGHKKNGKYKNIKKVGVTPGKTQSHI